MNIILFGNKYEKEKQFYQIAEFLLQEGNSLCVEEFFYLFLVKEFPLKKAHFFLFQKDTFNADLVISVGGDGTLLKSAAKVGEWNIPVLGVNAGRLGFLAESSSTDFVDSFLKIKEGEYSLETRTLLTVDINCCLPGNMSYALNEVAILKQDTASMITIKVSVGGEFLSVYEADGLIVATPTGSTAYSLSVGGPIMTPMVPCLLLTPVAPHTLTSRPLVIDDESVLDVEVNSRSGNFLLSLDGRSVALSSCCSFKIYKASHELKLIRPKGCSFFSTLRNKLFWGADPRYNK